MKKMYIILILLFCLAQPVSAQDGYDLAYAFDGDTARIVHNLKWGLINRELNEILPPRWDFLGDCIEGRRMIRQNDLFGFADDVGNQVIAPSYVHAENFSEGLACVKNAEGLWGYINSTGHPVIPCRFAAADSFSGGLALVQSEGLYGYIDSRGQTVIPLAYEEAYPFADGLACVKKDGLYGYIDITGAMVIPPQFELAFDFCEGAAVVKSGGYGLIDTTGAQLIPTVWTQMSPQVSGGLLKAVRNGRQGFIDTAGNPQTEFVYTHLGTFEEGLCPVATEAGWGYLNAQFSMVIPPVWDSAGSFSEGFAPVSKDGLYGYINTAGKIALAPQYVACGQVCFGLAPVCRQDGRYEFIRVEKFVSAFEGAQQQNTLTFRIGQPTMIVSGVEMALDVAPAIHEGHTLLPIRMVVEAIGGTVDWNPEDGKVTIRCQSHVVILHVGQKAAFVDGRTTLLAVPPVIENERALIPLRFVAESLDCDVHWAPETGEILVTY